MNRVLKVIVVVALSQICLISSASQRPEYVIKMINSMIALVNTTYTSAGIDRFIETHSARNKFFKKCLIGAIDFRNNYHPHAARDHLLTIENLKDIRTDYLDNVDTAKPIDVLEDAIFRLLLYQKYLQNQRNR